jgi:shikimate kinase
MGAGKTTIGKQIAYILGRPFFDSDREIEKRTGATIPLIFELETEAGFRARESAMLEELTGKENVVIATGGGAVLNENNRRLLASRGHVIYLCSPLEQLIQRTARDQNRPLLQTTDPRQTIENLLKIRDPLYREVAHTVLETDNWTVRQVITKILNLVNHQRL